MVPNDNFEVPEGSQMLPKGLRDGSRRVILAPVYPLWVFQIGLFGVVGNPRDIFYDFFWASLCFSREEMGDPIFRLFDEE